MKRRISPSSWDIVAVITGPGVDTCTGEVALEALRVPKMRQLPGVFVLITYVNVRNPTPQASNAFTASIS
jgi:hypothetical protein